MTPNLMKLKAASRASAVPSARRARRWGVVGALLVGLLPSISLAETPPPAAPPAEAKDIDLQVAKTEFENAQTLFIKEQFDDAAAHFLAAFARKPYPAFLFNAAVSFEKAKK